MRLDRKRALLPLALLALMIALLLPAVAHVVTGPWPRISFEVSGAYEAGNTLTVSAQTQDTEYVSWRLLRNGRGEEVFLQDSGGSIFLAKPGEYVLRGVARNGDRASAQTFSFTVGGDASSVGPYYILHISQSVYSSHDPVRVTSSYGSVLSVAWSMTVDGVPVDPPDLGISGGSFYPDRAGDYVLTATASCADGSEITEQVSFTVLPGPSLSFDVPLQVTAGEEVPISVLAEMVDESSVRVSAYREDGTGSLEGFTGCSGSLVFPEIGLYVLEVYGESLDGEAVGPVEQWVLARDVVETEPLAGSGGSGVNRRSLYSWHSRYITPQYEDELSLVLEVLDCDTLYQDLDAGAADQEVLEFLKRREEQGQRVYYLCGNTDWAIEPDAASMLAELEKVIAYNELAAQNGVTGFYGIQYDVEKLSQEDRVNQCVENYKTVYALAQQHGIKVEACISYKLDDYGFTAQLEDLIANGCDSVAIMNYYKKNTEADNIRYEVELCARYGKELINITETQPVGSHVMTEDETYFNDGLHAVEEMWRSLEAEYSGTISYSYHYLESIRVLLGLTKTETVSEF